MCEPRPPRRPLHQWPCPSLHSPSTPTPLLLSPFLPSHLRLALPSASLFRPAPRSPAFALPGSAQPVHSRVLLVMRCGSRLDPCAARSAGVGDDGRSVRANGQPCRAPDEPSLHRALDSRRPGTRPLPLQEAARAELGKREGSSPPPPNPASHGTARSMAHATMLLFLVARMHPASTLLLAEAFRMAPSILLTVDFLPF